MGRIEEILKEKQKTLDEMTYLDHQISAIDERVRFEELEEELVEALQKPQMAREVQDALRRKKRELMEAAMSSCDKIDLYITWLKEAELKLEERNREDDSQER